MKKTIASLFIVFMLCGTSSAFAYTARDLPPVTQGMSIELTGDNDTLESLYADKQKHLFEIASFTDIKQRDIAIFKLWITINLINGYQ